MTASTPAMSKPPEVLNVWARLGRDKHGQVGLPTTLPRRPRETPRKASRASSGQAQLVIRASGIQVKSVGCARGPLFPAAQEEEDGLTDLCG